jgi:tRNA threonylcarbamoyladenosine biosynthesis protein TsaB
MSESPVILALDTTTEFGSVAIRHGHKTAAEILLHSPDGFGHVIFGGIEDVLSQASTRLNEVDCFASANGPGSFTGVRVCLAAIKGLAEAMRKPATAISNLRALSLFGNGPLRAVALDARRGQVYGAVYDAQGRVVVPETVSFWAAWLETVPPHTEFVGFEDGPCALAGIAFTIAPRTFAPALARCAEMDGPGAWRDPAVLDANYVRRSDAELFLKGSVRNEMTRGS